jgi:hypothetical protein
VSARGQGNDLGDALARLAKKLERRNSGGLLQVRVGEAWRKVAGASVGEHTAGAHIRDGELVVLVDSPAWATELSALSEVYRQAINEEIGEKAVRTVRFTVSKKVAAEKKQVAERPGGEERQREDRPPSAPLTDQERAQVEMSAAAIEDEALRETVIRVTIADLEWKKGQREAEGRERTREGP